MTAPAQNTVTGGKAIVFGMTVLVFAMMAVVAQLPMPMQASLLAEGGPFENSTCNTRPEFSISLRARKVVPKRLH